MENDANLSFIKDFLDKNKESAEVKGLLKGYVSPDVDMVKSFLEANEEGKKFAQSFTDRRVTDAIKTFREGKFEEELKTRLESEIRRLNPQETAESKRAREAEDRTKKLEGELKRTNLINKGMLYMTSKGIKISEQIFNRLIGEDEPDTISNIDAYIAEINLEREKEQNRIYASNGIKPKAGDDANRQFGSFSEIQKYLQAGGQYTDGVRKEYERLAGQSSRKG